MRILLDSVCSRCGFRSSTEGLDLELAREVAASHVCADGLSVTSGEPIERVTFGPGEVLSPFEVEARLRELHVIQGVCHRHPHIRISTGGGFPMYDGLCGACEMEMDEDR
jgi:hypothetical protein